MTAIQAQPRRLGAADALSLQRLLDTDPIANCVVDGRLRLAPDLDPALLGGYLWGVADLAGAGLRAAAFHGGNLIPIGEDLPALEQLAGRLAGAGRGCSSIVGPVEAVEVMWPVLRRGWGGARALRAFQPLLCTRAVPDVPADTQVRAVRPDELERFLPAAVAMFTEELGVSPTGRDSGRSYRNRVLELIGETRAYARFDERGRVVFKAEIGALSAATAQLQGVWVHPRLRGRGIGTACMAQVLRLALGRAPSVSLYVNDYNLAGRAMYARLGLRQVGTLRTVLF
jgi:predicted GNAT family acetyltransferase